jgi:uncharacterized membrane protein
MDPMLESHILLLGWLAAIAAQIFWLHRKGTSKQYAQSVEEMREHILWKLFYINPDDPRAWVPKTWGPGTTINFRTRGQAYLFAFLILGTLATAIDLTTNVLGSIH